MNKIKSYLIQNFGLMHRYSKADKEKIAKIFNVSLKSVSNYASQIRKENPEYKEEKANVLHKIQTLRNANPPIKWREIAQMLNMSEDKIKKIYERHG